MKPKGDIHNTRKIIAKGIQVLNGDVCKRFYKVPIILLDYTPPDSAHPYAKGERFKLWIKLEAAEYSRIVKQFKPELKELSIWFDEENRDALQEFLKLSRGREDG